MIPASLNRSPTLDLDDNIYFLKMRLRTWHIPEEVGCAVMYHFTYSFVACLGRQLESRSTAPICMAKKKIEGVPFTPVGSFDCFYSV